MLAHVQRLLLVGLCGCRSILGIDGAGVAGDAPTDDMRPDGPSLCYGTGLLRVCVDTAAVEPRTISTQILVTTDTDCTFVLPQSGGPDVCVLASTTLAIEALGEMRAIGSRPLVLLATETILVAGSLDLGSYQQVNPGAGAAICAFSSGLSTGNTQGAGGAAGGSSNAGAGFGGAGGAGENTNTGGAGLAPFPLSVVRGGCPGGRGGTAQSSGGLGGAGGGAVYLIAGSSITVSGTINASGAAGGPPGERSGGGGGGSGGLIGLDSPVINIQQSASVFALGGGGASGGGAVSQGVAGTEASSATIPAGAAVGPSPSGAGGGGSTVMSRAGKTGGVGMAGGGGGGGGGGASGSVCTTVVVTAGSNIAPLPTSL